MIIDWLNGRVAWLILHVARGAEIDSVPIPSPPKASSLILRFWSRARDIIEPFKAATLSASIAYPSLQNSIAVYLGPFKSRLSIEPSGYLASRHRPPSSLPPFLLPPSLTPMKSVNKWLYGPTPEEKVRAWQVKLKQQERALDREIQHVRDRLRLPSQLFHCPSLS